LSIIDEAYVQHKLRDRGIELKCYNLNEFSKTNAEFQELLYYNFDTLITNNFNDIVRKFYNKQISHDDTLSQISDILKKLND
jgi:IS30 family transposase